MEGKKHWMTDEILSLMEERTKIKSARVPQGQRKFRQLRSLIKRKCRQAKEDWLQEKCSDIEKKLIAGKVDEGYRKMTENFSERKKKGLFIRGTDGKPLLEPIERVQRMQEHITQLYRGEEMPNDLLENAQEVDEDDIGDKITKDEFDRALNDINNNKAPGVDEIPVELLKNMGKKARHILYEMINEIYETGEMHSDYKKRLWSQYRKKREQTNVKTTVQLAL